MKLNNFSDMRKFHSYLHCIFLVNKKVWRFQISMNNGRIAFMKIIHPLSLHMKMTNYLTNGYKGYDIIMIILIQKINRTKNNNIYFLKVYHIISHTKPTSLIQHLCGTRFMQQPIQATPAQFNQIL